MILENKEFITNGFKKYNKIINNLHFKYIKLISLKIYYNYLTNNIINNKFKNPYIKNIKRDYIPLYSIYKNNKQFNKYINNILNLFGFINNYNCIINLFNLIIVKPFSPEQELHYDGCNNYKFFNIKKINMKSPQIFIEIPLEYTPLEQGPTILFKNNKIKELTNKDFYYKRNKGYFNKLPENIKKIYNNYKVQEIHNERDIIIWNNYTHHLGGKNNTNKKRYFILLSIILKPDLFHLVNDFFY